MNEFEKGYISGIVDGEGYIGIVKNKAHRNSRGFSYYPLFVITNTNLRMLLKVKEILRGGNIAKNKRMNPIYKQTYRYYAGAGLLRKILPSLTLVIKREEQQLILEALGILQKGKRKPTQDYILENIYQRLRKR